MPIPTFPKVSTINTVVVAVAPVDEATTKRGFVPPFPFPIETYAQGVVVPSPMLAVPFGITTPMVVVGVRNPAEFIDQLLKAGLI